MLSFMGQGKLGKLGKLATLTIRKEFAKTPNVYYFHSTWVTELTAKVSSMFQLET